MEFKRTMQKVLRDRARQYPVVTLTGPRQSGKTTLAQSAFPRYQYVNLEDPGVRDYARDDPREFLDQFSAGVILDEAQRVPDLFSYIQVIVDAEDRPGRFILTGSHNFLLMKSIRQSLAGRAGILHLLPFARNELVRRNPLPLSGLGKRIPRSATGATHAPDLLEVLFTGGYPRIHDKGLPPQVWLADYFRTYVERDAAEVLSVRDLEAFGRFVRLCAGRNGQLLNLSALAADCGITHPTARSWISILEASFLVKLLRPHHRNFNKRLIRSPKLHFLDTGLLCYLLRIHSPEELRTHTARGGVFESYVLAEFMKNFLNQGLEPDLWFWRDSRGREVDLIMETGGAIVPVEIKSARTVAADFFAGLNYWRGLAGDDTLPAALVYGGDECRKQKGTVVLSWSVL